MTETYGWLPKKIARYKRTMTLSTVINFLVPIGILAYTVIFKKINGTNKIIFIVLILVIIWFGIRNISKLKLSTGGDKLIIDDDGLTLHAYQMPDQHITFDLIKEVKDEYRGLRLIDKRDGFRNIIISNSFERFDEIRARLVSEGVVVTSF